MSVLGDVEIVAQFVIGRAWHGWEPEARFVSGIRALGVLASFQVFSTCLSACLGNGRNLL